jgi:predicted O-methyltransferase YrrM
VNLKRVFKPLAALAALAACALTLCSQAPDKTSMEFRKTYIEKFPWTTMNATAGDAMLLRILIETRGAKRGVEVGTNSGYGAINMGIAFERTKGHLDTLEISPKLVETARRHLAAVGLDETVTVIEGDALKTIAALEGEFDFVFIDAAKPQYLGYMKALEPRLRPGAVLVADNVIECAGQMRDFLDHMHSSPNWDCQIVRASMQKNDGMMVAYKLK